MHRIFGVANKEPVKVATPDEIMSNISLETTKANLQIQQCNKEYLELGERRKRVRQGTYTYTSLTNQMVKNRSKKQMYERKLDNLTNREMNMMRSQEAVATAQDATVQLQSLKQTTGMLKQQMKGIDLDKIERLQDEMADLLDMSNDIQETLSRAYDVPDEIDEADLDAELAALSEEVGWSAEMEGAGALPSFMVDEVPEFIDEEPQTQKPVAQEAAR